MNESIREQIRQSAALVTELAESLVEPTEEACRVLIEALRAGHRVYVCGNGGSAAQAQHLAAELVGRFTIDRPALPCVALTTDTSILTAVANDYNFEDTFERQVEALVGEGDVLVALSTSGDSSNVAKAAAFARRQGAAVIGMTGRVGGKLGQLSDITLAVPADTSALVQEGHLVLLHVICRRVEAALFARESDERTE